jgi:ketosteroid isomerase-like protein
VLASSTGTTTGSGKAACSTSTTATRRSWSAGEVLGVGSTAVNSLLSRARESVRAAAGRPQPGLSEPRVRELLDRYVRAWQLADIDGFVSLIAEDIRFSMPPLTAWFDGRDAAAAFIESAVFAPARPHGIHLRAGSCNGQPAFADYQPHGQGRLAVSGLQILQLADVAGQPLITALVFYRDPALAIRCGLPAVLS